jgi:beta-phosphoglucomutase-like phosphatase (HAD superfamily)
LGLLPEIDILVDGNSVSRTKPEPDLFLIAARQLGEPPETCVVVEDAAAGIDAAKAAGMRTVGLGPPEQVGAADLVLPAISGSSLSEIVEQLEGLGEDGYY